MNTFDGKVALVTGGSTGIGRATAIAFAQRGCRVVVAARHEEESEETVRLSKEAGTDAVFIRTDVSNAEDVENLVATTVDRFGRLDFAFNNAGAVFDVQLLADQEIENFDRAFAVNVRGVFLCMKYEIQQMLKQGQGGVIVNNISSSGFRNFMHGQSIYSATKHALIGLTTAAAAEYAEQGVRINAVAPGPVVTEGFQAVGEDLTQKVARTLPLKRMGKPEELAEAVLWLCSDAASFVVGHTLLVDGGYLGKGNEVCQLDHSIDFHDVFVN